MKKLLVILLGFCFALPAFAAGVRAVDNEAWLDHLAQMQVLRQQILSIITKADATPEDKALLESLNAEFAAQKANWDSYLVTVSEGQEAVVADTEKKEPEQIGAHACKGKCHGKKMHKKAWKKACAKGKDCCKITGKKCDGDCKDCDEIKKHKKHGKKHWAQHVCGDACKNGCIKPKMTDCCGSAMCKEVGYCIRNAKKAHESCKGCAKMAKCGKMAKKGCCTEAVKACPKGDKCCKITGKKCDGDCKDCSEVKKHGKKRWGRHVCGEACKDGCIKPKMTNCCGSAMCKELGHCIRDTKKASECPNGDKCCKVTGKKCDKPCKDCSDSAKKAKGGCC